MLTESQGSAGDDSPVKRSFVAGRRCQFTLGDFAAALAHYENIVRLEPRTIRAHVLASHCLLALGAAGRGWREFGWTWQLPGVHKTIPLPEWTPGREGRRLLVEADMAFGEVVFFSRFLPLLASGLELTAVAPKPLRGLLESTGYFAAIEDIAGLKRQDAERFDAWVPLMKLPHLLRSDTIVLPEAERWRRLPPMPLPEFEGPGLRVGIVWETSVKNHEWLAGRNLPFDLLRRLFEVPGCRFYSLQVGEAARDLESLPAGAPVTDLSPHLTDFAATARCLAALDMVVSVDTAVANLAATMGLPTCVLLMRAADWRWGVGERSHWYPAARLFRQDVQGDWNPVVERLSAFLAAAAQGR